MVSHLNVKDRGYANALHGQQNRRNDEKQQNGRPQAPRAIIPGWHDKHCDEQQGPSVRGNMRDCTTDSLINANSPFP